MLTILVYVVLTVAIVAVVLWALNNIPQIDPALKNLLRVIIIAVTVIWLLLTVVGLLPVPQPFR